MSAKQYFSAKQNLIYIHIIFIIFLLASWRRLLDSRAPVYDRRPRLFHSGHSGRGLNCIAAPTGARLQCGGGRCSCNNVHICASRHTARDYFHWPRRRHRIVHRRRCQPAAARRSRASELRAFGRGAAIPSRRPDRLSSGPERPERRGHRHADGVRRDSLGRGVFAGIAAVGTGRPVHEPLAVRFRRSAESAD